MTVLLLLTIATLACATLIGHYREIRWLFVLAKPGTTIAILLLAAAPLFSESAPTGFYLLLILLGLLFSLGGDIGLMFGKRGFILGLVSFLLGHVLYAVAFFPETELANNGLVIGLIGLYSIGYMAFLLPYAGRLKLPVVGYFIAISAMVWFAINRWQELGSDAALVASVGAVLFAVSDSILAINRFVRPFHVAQALILGTYYLGQTLIALSTHA